MAYRFGPVMTIHVESLPEETLHIQKLDGREEISRPYRFTLDLAGQRADLNPDDLVGSHATIEFLPGALTPEGRRLVGPAHRIHGRIDSVRHLPPETNYERYRIVLVPEIRMLALRSQSRIFLDKAPSAFVEEVLKSAGLSSRDYEFRLTQGANYPAREYVVQYEESDLDFVSRWLEHEGISYHFVQDDEGERIVFTDSVASLPPIEPVRFRSVAHDHRYDWFDEEFVRSFVSRRRIVPREVILQDYNWRHPSLDLRCSAVVSEEGEGVVYEYNNHYRTPEHGKVLAAVRAEEILCRAKVIRGEGHCRAFRAGSIFELTGHPRPSANGRYLLTKVRHQAVQDLEVTGAVAITGAGYQNEFVCIPADAPFRPRRKTPWPAIRGVMHAKIDGQSDGTYAELDDQGRYKVKLPLDLSDRGGGTASRYVRMAQPYAGADHGMHFPLHKGTEVILTHIDGDPDRPIIAGAVPNAQTGSVVHGATQTSGGIKTAGGNQIAMEDTEGHQRIIIRAGGGKSGIIVGSGSEDRFEVATVHATMFGLAGTVTAGLVNTFMGAMSTSMTAGYPVTQLLIGAVNTACNFGSDYLGEFILTRDKWAGPPIAVVVSGALALVGEVVFNYVQGKLVEDHVEAIVKVNSLDPTAPVENPRWWSKVKKFGEDIKDIVTGAASEGYGGYLIRCKGGTQFKLNRQGEGLLIASEKGTLVLYGKDVDVKAINKVFLTAKSGFYLLCDKGAFALGDNGVAMNYKQHNLTMDSEGIQMRTPEDFLLYVGSGPMSVNPGHENYFFLTSDGSSHLSAQEEFRTVVGDSIFTVDAKNVSIGTGALEDGCLVEITGDGTVSIFSKAVKIVAETVEVGDSTTEVKISGKSVEIKSQGALTMSSGSPATINDHTVFPPSVSAATQTPSVPPARRAPKPPSASIGTGAKPPWVPTARPPGAQP